jgi:hypothetical protein
VRAALCRQNARWPNFKSLFRDSWCVIPLGLFYVKERVLCVHTEAGF